MKSSTIEMHRVLDREPVSLELTWVPQAIGKRLANADLATRDTFLIIENDCDVSLGHAGLRIERLTRDASGQPVDFEYLYFRRDAFQCRLRIDREKIPRNKR